MSFKKQYFKTKDTCKVTFTLSKKESHGADTAFLVGEFNDWAMHSLPMKKMKDGSFKIAIELDRGKSYQFRYLLDDERWENDWNADEYVYSEFGDCENSVIIT
jgi:1,4-alpha-glucan branching enzyme